MPETNVNRLAREIEEAAANAKKLYNEHHAPRMYGWPSLAAQTASWNRYQKALQKVKNMTERLKTMNKNALQVQLAKIANQRKNLNKNLNKAMEGYGFGERNLIENVFREYAHWTVNNDPKKIANKIRNLEAKIERLPNATIYNKYKKAIAPIALKFARVRMNENALQKAVALRKKHIGPSSAKVASIVKRAFTPARNAILIDPLGTRTLEAHRQFNKMAGRQTNYLENYAKAMREVRRLQKALKRKRNNNNRN